MRHGHIIISVIDQTLHQADEILAKLLFGVCFTKSNLVNKLKKSDTSPAHQKRKRIKGKTHGTLKFQLSFNDLQLGDIYS